MYRELVKYKGNFETNLAFYSAPTLLGIKPASLFSFLKTSEDYIKDIKKFNDKASEKGLKIYILCECESKLNVILYNEKLMRKQLLELERQELLYGFGYKEIDNIESLLNQLGIKIKKDNKFPHEIGIFLGCPVEDIKGFIENKGKNYLCEGFWKVYSSEQKTKKVFNNYRKCRRFLCDKLSNGSDIYQALKI